MTVMALFIQRRFIVEVDETGVTLLMGGTALSIPWSDTERVEGHHFSARLLRKSNGKRAFVSMLDLGWENRPVTRAIRVHLDT
jgi:hypothetical protein